MKKIEDISKSIENIINDIDSGRISLPQFQRDYVWTKEKAAELIDSILNGFVIGLCVIWRTNVKLRTNKQIKGSSPQLIKDGQMTDYILDGQQRTTSLYLTLKGKTVQLKKKIVDFGEIWLDLDTERVAWKTKPTNSIKVSELIDPTKWYEWHSKPIYLQVISRNYKKITDYKIQTSTLENYSIEQAAEQFRRINIGGQELGDFEIMCAITYDDQLPFDLEEKYEELNQDLGRSNYSISHSQLLQYISILLTRKEGSTGGCASKDILNLNKSDFINIWDEATRNIKSAVDHLRQNWSPTDKTLPFSALIVLYAYYFNKSKTLSSEQKQRLDDLFVRISYGSRYSSGLEGKLIQDIGKIDKIINGELPEYIWSIDTSPTFILNNGGFKPTSAFTKMFLTMLQKQQPKSFKNNTPITIDGNWQLTKNSSNYHHFFAKNYLKDIGDSPDHIMNITIIDDSLNKSLGDKKPSIYISTLENENPNIKESLKTHLIGDLEEFGIVENDYQKFKYQRALCYSKLIETFTIPQNTGNEPQDIEDLTEEELTED